MTNVVVDAENTTWGASGVGGYYPGDNNYLPTVSNLASNNATPNIWLVSDSLAKSFHSTIMTDLGQVTAAPNILLNATALQIFTQNFTYMQGQKVNAIPGPANDSYEALKDKTGHLGTTPAVFSTKYLCRVPRRKSTGIIILSVLVADLVFMQVLWKVLTLFTITRLERKDPEGNYEFCTRLWLCGG